jgi:hypothetical protein
LLPCWPLVMLCTPNHGWVLIVRAAAWRLPGAAEHDGLRVQASPSAVSVSPGHSGAGSARLAAWCFFRSCSGWPRIPFVQRSETRPTNGAYCLTESPRSAARMRLAGPRSEQPARSLHSGRAVGHRAAAWKALAGPLRAKLKPCGLACRV